MCFCGEMSAFFASTAVVMAYISKRAGHPLRVQVPILYFGLMELLQTVQYMFLAVPEDGYSMCKSPTNQFLTVIGLLHIVFQPFFCNMAVTATSRTRDVRYRYENAMISKLCLLAAVWMFSRYLMVVIGTPGADPDRATEACPNYEWIRDGYDGGISWDTPNLPGHSCTFRSNTPTGHLAWALPMAPATYFIPGTSVHFFLMFAPSLVSSRHTFTGIMNLMTGPVLAAALTASLNEQAAVWCFFSMFQCLFCFVAAFISKAKYGDEQLEQVDNKGDFGEEPMLYERVQSATNGTNGHTNGHANGKKVN